MTDNNPYTTILTSTLLNLISGLQNLSLPIYQDFVVQPPETEARTLFSILPVSDVMTDSRYLLIRSDPGGIPRFLSVNEQQQGVLLTDYKQINSIRGLIVSYKNAIYLVYKNRHYAMKFPVADIDRLRPSKASIMNMFSMNGATFVLWNYLVLHFTQFTSDGTTDPYYRLTYIGRLEVSDSTDKKACHSYVAYDYCGGTLVGLIDRHPFFFMNRFGLGVVNQFPYTNFVGVGPTSLNRVIFGGLNTYSIYPAEYFDETAEKLNLWQINVTTELQYQFDELPTDDSWGYVPLKQIVYIPGTDCTGGAYGPFYILGFSSDTLPSIAFTGTTQFINSDNTLLSIPLPITLTNSFGSEDWSVYPAGGSKEFPEDGYLYFVWSLVGEQMMLTIYEPTFGSFISKFRANTAISDLLYSQHINQTLVSASNHQEWDAETPYEDRNNRKTLYDSFFTRNSPEIVHPFKSHDMIAGRNRGYTPPINKGVARGYEINTPPARGKKHAASKSEQPTFWTSGEP